MAKKEMKRPDNTHTHPKNDIPPVPELQGSAKHTHKKANPVIPGTSSPALKVYHSKPHSEESYDRPISKVYSEIDTDLARDNLENDMTFADKQDL